MMAHCGREWEQILTMQLDKKHCSYLFYFISDSRQIFCLIEAFIPAQTITAIHQLCSVKSASDLLIANSVQVCASKNHL